MSVWRDLITGSDNETVAIGRALGILVFALFIVAVPIVAVATLVKGVLSGDDWSKTFAALQIYIPAVILSVAGLIGLTAPSEPKQ